MGMNGDKWVLYLQQSHCILYCVPEFYVNPIFMFLFVCTTLAFNRVVHING